MIISTYVPILKERCVNKVNSDLILDTFVLIEKFNLHRSYKRYYSFIQYRMPDDQWENIAFWKNILWRIKFIMFQERFFPEAVKTEGCQNHGNCQTECICGGFYISEEKLKELNDISKLLNKQLLIA